MGGRGEPDTPCPGRPDRVDTPAQDHVGTSAPDQTTSPTPHDPNTPSTRRPRRRRRRRTALLVTAVLVVALALTMRTPSPVGHWDGAEGQDRYLAAYREAFADLPEPTDTLDVRTDFGVVRLYRYQGSGPADHPMVLLPGTASGSPVMGDNLPSLLQLGDVYLIDLLGQPGRSVQERPITSAADQAAWLDQTLAALPENSFHLVGLSIGGWTAVNLALHSPQRVESLILLDPVYVFDDMPWETILRSVPAAFSWLPKS